VCARALTLLVWLQEGLYLEQGAGCLHMAGPADADWFYLSGTGSPG